jgi:hypothetical protein
VSVPCKCRALRQQVRTRSHGHLLDLAGIDDCGSFLISILHYLLSVLIKFNRVNTLFSELPSLLQAHFFGDVQALFQCGNALF